MKTRLAPVSRSDLIRFLKLFGFTGPYQSGRHEFMVKGRRRLILPNPHKKTIGVDLLIRILKQAGISRREWLEKTKK